MTIRTLPSWFQANHYDYLYTCSPTQWYQELSRRREMKALYELCKNEEEIFIDHAHARDTLSIYEHFFKSMETLRAQNPGPLTPFISNICQ